jgi:DNA-binding NarL/FixJ family response regulator
MAMQNKEIDLAIKTQGFAISICVQQNNFQNIQNIINLVPVSKAMRVSKQARKMLVHSLFLKFSTSFKVKPAIVLSRIIDKVNIDDKEGLWQFSTLLSKAFLYGVIGDFSNADQIIRGLTCHPVALTNDRWRALGLQLSCYLSFYMGEKDTLLQLADELTSLGLKYADGFASSYGANYTAIMKYQSRDLAGAIEAAEKAETLFAQSNNFSMALLSGIQKTSWQAELESNGGYAEFMKKQTSALEAAGGNENLLAMAKILTAAQFMQEGGFGQAEALLLDAWKWAKSKQAMQAQCSIAMHLSALYREKKDFRREDECLKFFGETAVRKGYVFFREMRFASLIRACARCVEKNIAPQYMGNLAGKYFGFEAVTDLLQNFAAIAEAPDAFIKRFPVNQSTSHSKNVWIKLFGSAGLSVDGNEIDPGVFKTRKISGIFRYILANPDQSFTRERLAAAFWPDSGGKTAANSLNVALFELRKTLADLDMAFDGENTLLAEDGNGFDTGRPEAVESDAARLTFLRERLREGGLTGDDEKNALAELINIYDGEYLEDCIAEDCIVIREDCRRIYSESVRKLAEIYRAEGQADLAEALLLRRLKIVSGGLSQDEIKIVHFLLEGISKRDIQRRLRMNATEINRHESAIRHKLSEISGFDLVLSYITKEYSLTPRETDMLRGLQHGRSNEEIAAELFISDETVRTHVRNLMNKLSLENRNDVPAWVEEFRAMTV